MLKIVKLGGGVVGAGLVIGLGVVGWMRVYPQESEIVSSQGGTIALDPAPKSAAPSDPESLRVMGSAAPTPTPTPGSAAIPQPEAFGQYDRYRDAEAALFGDAVVGTGAEVVLGSTLAVHYRGWLTNGTLFDESYKGGKPFVFKEGDHRVIAGWEQGVLGMKVGGKRRVIVPPAAGYGSAGQGPIPANAVLVFDIELLAVQ